jgi:hypothetical protein
VKRTFNLAVVITVVLSAATVAFAVAGTSKAPRATDVPVMVTDRAASVAATPAIAAAASAAPTAHANKAARPKSPKPSNKTNGTSVHTWNRPAVSQNSAVSGKKKSSPTKPSGASSSKPSVTDTHGKDDDFEVVKPIVHDSDHDDYHKAADENSGSHPESDSD